MLMTDPAWMILFLIISFMFLWTDFLLTLPTSPLSTATSVLWIGERASRIHRHLVVPVL